MAAGEEAEAAPDILEFDFEFHGFPAAVGLASDLEGVAAVHELDLELGLGGFAGVAEHQDWGRPEKRHRPARGKVDAGQAVESPTAGPEICRAPGRRTGPTTRVGRARDGRGYFPHRPQPLRAEQGARTV